MSESTKVLLVGGGLLAAWYLFLRPRPVITSATVPPPQNQYGAIAGYAPRPNYPSDPGDVNNWIPAITAGIGAIGQIASSAINTYGGPSQSTGQYNQQVGYGAPQYNPDPYYANPN